MATIVTTTPDRPPVTGVVSNLFGFFSHVVLADVDVPAGSTSVLQVSKYIACCGVASLLYYCSAMSIEFERWLNSKLGALRATGHRIVLFVFPIILRR